MPPDQDVALATLAVTVAAHIEQCKTDKAEIKAALSQQNADRLAMHRENQGRFRRLEMVYYFISAAIGIGMFLGTATGQRVLAAIHP